MRYIRRELRHYLKQPAFWLSVSIVLFCFFFEHRSYLSFYLSGKLLFHLDAFYLFTMPFEYGLFLYLVPLAAIPPAALSVIEELKSGHARLKLYRSSRRGYILKRLISISIGSMMPMLMGCLLFLGFSMLIGPITGESGLALQATASAAFRPLISSWQGIPYLLFVVGQATLSAWLWGMVGTLLALATLNKGMTLMNGFLLFWGIDCLLSYLSLTEWRPFILFFSSLQSSAPLWSSWTKTLLMLMMTISVNAILMNCRYKRL